MSDDSAGDVPAFHASHKGVQRPDKLSRGQKRMSQSLLGRVNPALLQSPAASPRVRRARPSLLPRF